jgi:uncharacterized damage-inducible protein DinB
MATTRDSLLAEFDHEVATARKLLERVPDHKLAWKPHEKSMSLGDLSTRLGSVLNWASTILNETSFNLDAGSLHIEAKTSGAEILALFDDSSRRARAAMNKTDAEYQVPWSLRWGGRDMFSMPRVSAFRTFVLYHLVHHRGQLSVYLRLNDIPVPPIYGPTADES